jgi:hypothetical protein
MEGDSTNGIIGKVVERRVSHQVKGKISPKYSTQDEGMKRRFKVRME